ncbi:MAG: 3-oxoacyl-ACP synthase [Actinomycetota bacterium]|nr:3-oxoacyl-ACP synthase [Actinomycetota bacterium]
MSWAITGMGAVASVGHGVGEVFEALCAGRSGLAELRGFDPGRFRARQAYEIDDRPERGVDRPGRATGWLVAAVEAALLDSGGVDELDDVPVLVGTGLRELRSLELWWRDGCPLDPSELHFGAALRSRLGTGASYTFANACSASLYALGLGADLLALERADTVVVSGVDSITESMFGLLDRVHPEPPDAVRPFDRCRKGVLMGEGAAAVVLRREADVAPGAAHARLRSVAMSCDAYHVTAPDPDGIERTIREAHERAGLGPHDVDLVLLHGTGTLLNDQAEASALDRVFTSAGASPLMTAVKSMTGHTSGGSGLLGVVVAAEALKTGRVPPTVGLSDPLPEAQSFRFAQGGGATSELGVAQVDAFGFGGLNAVAVLEKVA